MKKFLALLLALTMVLSLAACGNKAPEATEAPKADAPEAVNPEAPAAPLETVYDYTYHSSMTALGNNWNPHAWEMSNEDTMMQYVLAPLATMSIEDSINGVYQWIYVAADSVEDVTADHQDDLTKYMVTLPSGQTAEQTEKGFVFEIKLNPDMKWENGDVINADSYIYSMKALLDPAMKNYRANLYVAGESAVAGGSKYYYSDAEGTYETLSSQGFASIEDALAAGETVYFDPWNLWGAEGYIDANGNECPQYLSVTDEVAYSADGKGEDEFTGASLYAGYASYMQPGGGYDAVVYRVNEFKGATYDVVGCYKVDEYTIRYVTQTALDINYFLTSCASNWLVHEGLYEAGKDTSGTLVTTNYCTSKETTMSCGPYRIESLQAGKQVVYVKNENYYLFEQDETGRYVGYTEYLVDGESVEAYMADRLVIDVMDVDATKQAFLKGQLDEWTPTADDMVTYATSDQMYKAPETYTMSLFFCTGLDYLKEMDKSKGNTNSVVMSNINFRKAMSLSFDRNEWVGATEGFIPAFSMLNSLYYYDAYNDPTSSYRNSDPAKQAIVNFYGVEYGAGTPYADLNAAHDSINGYNLTEAQELMKQACAELVAEGLYTEGEPIHIRMGWAKGALGSPDNQQASLLQKYINAAAEGSGFGPITLEPIGNINNRYADVAAGEFAIGYGAWGGAAFYPFRNFQVYCDPDQYDIHEAGCWDPKSTMLTLTVEGEEVTKSWQEWSGCMVGSGDMAEKSFETKLQILAAMEEAYMNFFYRIPLASSTAPFLMSYQVNQYTADYNIMYGFGGIELATFNYTDAEWDAYVAEQGGTLSYE